MLNKIKEFICGNDRYGSIVLSITVAIWLGILIYVMFIFIYRSHNTQLNNNTINNQIDTVYTYSNDTINTRALLIVRLLNDKAIVFSRYNELCDSITMIIQQQ